MRGHRLWYGAAMAEENCVFCKIGRGDIPAGKLFDDGRVFAVRDVNPKAPAHILVIPYAHVEALAEAPPDGLAAAARCIEAAPEVARDAGIAASGYRLVANQGPDSGQEVPHFHLHVLGGRALGPMG